MIFSYLSVRDLLAIQSLNVQRFTEISLTLKCADFSVCNTIQADEVSAFFTRDRAAYIREINFNNVFFVKASNLEKYIIKCKHLIKLSAYECGLTYTNILCILLHCKKLEELYWSVLKKETSLSYDDKDNINHKLKKLYLSVKRRVLGSFIIVCDLLEKCICTEEVCVSVSPYFTMSLPPSRSRETFAGKLACITNCPVSVVVHGRIFCCHILVEEIMNKLMTVHNFEIAKLDKEKSEALFFTNHSSFLQIMTESEQLTAIPPLPENSVHSLILILADSKADLLNHMEMLKRVTGKKLKHFTVHTRSEPMILYHRGELLETSDGHFLCDIITQMASTCLNIQVLNLSELHFDVYFTFKALHCLKQLKTFSLSACSLREPSSTDIASHSQVKEFENMVLQCTNVERFSLHNCFSCKFGPTDDSVLPICGWLKLSHLLVSDVSTFRTCSFLTRIPEFCPQFTSLEIIRVGNPSVCHYTQNVIQVLRKCKQLTFLRINQKSFYPVNSLFWKSVGMAKNLQGLCVCTDIDTVIDNKMVTDAIKQLPFLHLFHVIGRRICQNFPTQIKKILSKNGVQVQKVEVPLNETRSYFAECCYSHFPVL